MRFPAYRVLQVILTALIVSCAIVLMTSVQFFVYLLLSDFLWIALGSVVLIHLTVRPHLSDVVLAVACTTLSCLVVFGTLALPFHARIIPAFFGLSSLVILAARAIWAEGAERKILLCAFVPACSFVGTGWLTGPLLKIGDVYQTKVFDLFLNSYESSLRIQPSFLMGLAYFKWPWFKTLGLVAYLGLPVPIALAYGLQLKRTGEKALPIFLALFYCGPLGALLYNIFPAIGPRQLFLADFPLHPQPIADVMRLHLHAIAMKGVRNAMPSMHMVWVLLAWWYSRGTAWWARTVTSLFLVFTVMATMGTGEHYLIDLLVAFPVALFVRALFSFDLSWKHPARALTVVTGVLGTFGWFGLLRFGSSLFWISPAIPWLLAVTTIVGACMQEGRLARAEATGKVPDVEPVPAPPADTLIPEEISA